jgi:hypothetical protein
VVHQFELICSLHRQRGHRSGDDPDVVPIRDVECDLSGDFIDPGVQGGVMSIGVELASGTDEYRHRV